MDSASLNIILTFRSVDDNYLNKNGSDSKESACGSADLVYSPWTGKIPLENSMDREAWLQKVT